MKTVREVIRRTPVWVNPGHTVETAVILMRGHAIGSLPVMQGSDLVGIVLYSHLLGENPERPVSEIMTHELPTLAPEMSVRTAADVMSQTGLGRLPVLEQGHLIGVVSSADLLPEVGRSFDPRTELPWADALRDWAIQQLQDGQEITVLFIDLDRFGQFNKVYGHIVGDEVLEAVARTLVDTIEPAVDFLCRYGGDEFCIGTLRSSGEATELGVRIAQRVADIRLASLGEDVRVTCSVGQFGGKRTREREHTHYLATINSLINLASQDCTAHKPARTPGVPAAGAQPAAMMPRLRLAWIDVDYDGTTATARVDLQIAARAAPVRGGRRKPTVEPPARFPATRTRETDEEGIVPLVAEATAEALSSALPEGHDYELADVLTEETADAQTLITAVGRFITPTQQISVAGSTVVGTDPYRAAAGAVLASMNRLMGRILLARETPTA